MAGRLRARALGIMKQLDAGLARVSRASSRRNCRAPAGRGSDCGASNAGLRRQPRTEAVCMRLRDAERRGRALLQVVRHETGGRMTRSRIALRDRRSPRHPSRRAARRRRRSPGRAAQMPDPKAMSGMPLPVPDLPVGTVTARVIRGALTNPLAGETVELTGAGVSQDGARPTRPGAPPSMASRPARGQGLVVVNGERVESQEFDVRAAGGMRADARRDRRRDEQKAAADRKLAEAPAVPGAVVLGEQSRFVIEVGDDALNVFYILQIVNTAKQPVDDGGPLVFDLPGRRGRRGNAARGRRRIAVAAGTQVTVTGPFRAGQHARCSSPIPMPLGSEEIVARAEDARAADAAVGGRAEDRLACSCRRRRSRRSARWMPTARPTSSARAGAVKAGDTLTLTLSDLPHRPTWPRNLRSCSPPGPRRGRVGRDARARSPKQARRRQQLHARRDKLFAELADARGRSGGRGRSTRAVYASRRERARDRARRPLRGSRA